MRDLMLNIAARRSDIEMIVHMGDLDDGVRAVLSRMETGIDAIISRGGTAEIIRKKFSVPTCEISLSVYDVLRAIRLAQNFSDHFAVVGFLSITEPVMVLCDLMQYDIKTITINSASEAEECLISLKTQGYTLVVGDMVTVTSAKRLGMKGILITSGIESVEAAIDNAVQLHRYYAEVKDSLSLLSDVVSSTENDVIVFDASGKQCFSTIAVPPPSLTPILEKSVPSVISGDSLKLIRKIENRTFSIEGRYLNSSGKDYCMYSIANRPYSEEFNDQAIRYLNPEDDIDSGPFENFLGDSDKIRDMINTMNRYSIMDMPVLLLGEAGTGKDRFAHYLYKHSLLKSNTFIYIDCYMMSDKHWRFLLESDNSPLSDSGLTIYIKRLGSATAEQRIQLKTYLKSTSTAKRNRMLFSFTLGRNFNERDELYLYLAETLSCLMLQVPPLRQRPSDIPILVGLYINALNISLGTQVLGFIPEAMLLLQNFPWERNIDQLIRIVRELVITARTSYISASGVQAVLSRESDRKYVSNHLGINLNRPLNEITREIAMTVFEEEEMNQTKTAKRLGISRSTLWRMLK
jgi:Transcriptional regulator containing PAS, AAA-type ATPase, and DNA-binding domains